MQPILSIIIPVYNSERYLPELLCELKKQSQEIDYKCEIILVDDGSTDKSSEVYNQYVSNFKIIKKSNEGACVARNVGLMNATGEYIAFIDSDDYISSDYISKIVSECRGKRDLLLFGYAQIFEDERRIFYTKDDSLCNKTEFYEAYLEQKYNRLWDKVFKRSIIERYNIKFDNKVVMGEDYIFILEYIKHISTISVIKDCLYYYKFNENSLCSNVRTSYLKDLDCMYEKSLLFFQQVSCNENVQYIAKVKMLESIFRAIGLCQKDKKNYRAEIIGILNKCPYVMEVINSQYTGFKNKLMRFLIKNKLYGVTKLLVKLRHKL